MAKSKLKGLVREVEYQRTGAQMPPSLFQRINSAAASINSGVQQVNRGYNVAKKSEAGQLIGGFSNYAYNQDQKLKKRLWNGGY